MSTVLITGGTGLIGNALSRLLLRKGHEVIILSRSKKRFNRTGLPNNPRLSVALWNTADQTIDENAVGRADAIIQLAGANVGDKRWTSKRKDEIASSRVRACELIVKALKEIPNHVKTVVSASAIGWYGHDKGIMEPFTEADPSDQSFLGETCRLWEAGIDPVTALGKRLVKLRTGIVLSREGGAYPAFEKPTRFGIAAILGSGKQMISWVHIDDLCRMYADGLEQMDWKGVYNAVAPNPISNKALTLQIARKTKGRFFIPFYVPSFLVKAILGEMSTEVLNGANVSAEKIREHGFRFLYPSIESALNELTGG